MSSAFGKSLRIGGASGATRYFERTQYDAAGQAIKTIAADGGVVTTRYDGFGRKIGTIDELGHETVLGYDRTNHLTSTRHMLSTELYAYDELGHRKQQTITYTVFNTATGGTITKVLTTDYLLDTRGLILKTILPAKDQTGAPTVRDQLTIDRYDYAGRKVAEINANGDTAYWTYTANGKLATHTDLGGQVSTYTYDANAGYLAGIKSRRPDPTPGAPAGSMVDARDTRYEYDTAGQLRRIVDAGANQITEVAYDAMGRHARESLTQGGTVIRDTRIGYDGKNGQGSNLIYSEVGATAVRYLTASSAESKVPGSN